MNIDKNEDKIKALLERRVAEVIVKDDLAKKLVSGRPLRIKLGIDPTGSLLHLGHMVVLKKLRDFQELGHQVIFLIGDYTARIGDPTGRSVERKPLSDETIATNMKDYVAQASLILDMSKVEIRYNSEWLNKLNFQDLIELTSKVTYAQVAQRADFKKRISAEVDITLQEFMYPVMQGYDSVALEADVEIGGTDQKFNLLMGRQLQKRYNQAEQDVVTCPLLEGLAGTDKMSKSLNNYVGLNEAPADIYGKVMSIGDDLIEQYYTLCTDIPLTEIGEMVTAMKQGTNPRDFKMKLAYTIVHDLHGQESAESAQNNFISVVQQKSAPTDIKEVSGATILESAVCYFAEAKSKAEIKRLVSQGAVSVNGVKIDSFDAVVKSGDVIQMGKRDWFKIK